MKFKDLPAAKQYEMYQAFRKGEINNLEDLDKFYPKEAPKGLQTIDSALGGAADAVNNHPLMKMAKEFDKNFEEKHPYLAAPEKIAKAIMSAPGEALDWVGNTVGIPKGPEMADILPKTSAATGLNPNARDLGMILALEGVGRGGTALKNYGERGTLRAFEKGKPVLPPTASKDIVADILDKNYLPHHEAAADIIADNALRLKERGLERSRSARDISDSSPLSISPQRIEQLHEFFPEHPAVKDLKARLDASRAGAITQDFVEDKPGYTKQEKILTPSEVVQRTPEQSDLFDQEYYNSPDAHSKPVSDFTASEDRGVFPTPPTIQKPIEPNLEGSASKTPANYQFKETEIPPEGHYDFQPDSLYDIFSHANSNRHKAWQRDPITGQPIAKNKEFGEMMHGLRTDLRSIKTPLTPEQTERIKMFSPEFSGSTIGEAITHLNEDTSSTIRNQKALTKTGIEAGPLGFMDQVYSNPDKRAFAQKIGRDYGMNSLLDFADKYGSSKDYAKELSSYMEKGVEGPGFNPDKFAKHAMYGGVPLALANEAGKLVGSPSRRYNAAKALGGFAEKLKPTNLLKMSDSE